MSDVGFMVLEKLKLKRDMFNEMEKISNEMLDSGVDDFLAAMDNRQKVMDRIDTISSEIEKISKSIDNIDILAVIKNKCPRDSVAEEYLECFDIGQDIYSIINRINNIDIQCRYMAENEKNIAEKKIREMNSSNANKVAKYATGVLSTTEGKGNHNFDKV